MIEMWLCVDWKALGIWWAENRREILCGVGILALLCLVGMIEG